MNAMFTQASSTPVELTKPIGQFTAGRKDSSIIYQDGGCIKSLRGAHNQQSRQDEAGSQICGVTGIQKAKSDEGFGCDWLSETGRKLVEPSLSVI